jgi:hypothetical protein
MQENGGCCSILWRYSATLMVSLGRLDVLILPKGLRRNPIVDQDDGGIRIRGQK